MKIIYLITLFLLTVGCNNSDKFTVDDSECIKLYNESTEDKRVQIYIDCTDKLENIQTTTIQLNRKG